MYFSFGRVWICSRVSAALFVSTISASAARGTTSCGGVRSWMAQSPSEWRSFQVKSPGFNVKPSKTTILILGRWDPASAGIARCDSKTRTTIAWNSDYENFVKNVSQRLLPNFEYLWLVFRNGLAGAQAECLCNFSRPGQHHAGLAGDGDELKAFLDS